MELTSKFKARKIVSQMIKKTKLNEAEAKVYFYKMVSASYHQQDQGDGLRNRSLAQDGYYLQCKLKRTEIKFMTSTSDYVIKMRQKHQDPDVPDKKQLHLYANMPTSRQRNIPA